VPRLVHRVVILLALLAAACGGGSSSAPAGTETGPCYPNGTCNAGLLCLSNLCVRPGDGGIPDAGPPDGPADAASPDGAGPDLANPDLGPPDLGPPDQPVGPDTTGPDGTAAAGVTVLVSCASEACGAVGTLVARVLICLGEVDVAPPVTLAGATLTAGTPVAVAMSPVPVGSFCVQAFLDRDGDLRRGSGDFMPTSGDTPVAVHEGLVAEVPVTLDMAVP
jgi:hypothetical protein